MNLVMPLLELLPGTTICLHIPHGFGSSGETLERELLQLANRQGKSAAICRPAHPSRVIRMFSPNQRTTKWLSRATGITEVESRRIIAGLGVPIAEKLLLNAGTERCLLGIVATLYRKPQVVAYSTAGLDVKGRRKVHQFVLSKCSCLCTVHLSYPSVFGNGSPHPRECPPGADCVTLPAT